MEGINDYNKRGSFNLPSEYFNLSTSQEKNADILLEKVLKNYSSDNVTLYANHEGTEKTYYISPNGPEALPKEDNGLADYINMNNQYKKVILIEGKQWSTRNKGYSEVVHYGKVVNKIKHDYKDCEINCWVTINGGKEELISTEMREHPEILMVLSNTGKVYLSKNSPPYVVEAFENQGFKIY